MEMQKRKKVGILGGTFDPIHTGHLILAENAYEAFGLDEVLIMPNGNPPHKPGTVNASMEQRIQMVQLAAADNPHLRVSDLEKEMQGYHYTYETLEFLTKEHPNTDYYFILGADSLFQFHTWKEPARICKCCTILVATRDHTQSDEMQDRIKFVKETFDARIELLETPNMDISSNMLREKVQNNRSIKYYVPALVEQYIMEHNLYRRNEVLHEEL